jgi:hypothetical protein
MKPGKPFVIIEDPIDSDHVDPMRGSRIFERDRHAVQTDVITAVGDGCHLIHCLECDRRFYAKDERDALCPVCDAGERVRQQRQEQDYTLHYDMGRRDRVRNGFYPD